MALIIKTACAVACAEVEAKAEAKALCVQTTMDLALGGLREAEKELHFLEAEVFTDTPEKKALVFLALEAVQFAKNALAQLATLKHSELKHI